MKNQMHLDDYWRRILAEVWVMKHGGGQGGEDLGDGLVTHSSQPCLGEMGEDNLGMRKTVSMGDLIDSSDNPEQERAASPTNPNLLGVPGAGGGMASVQDTVKSLRQFLTSAQLPQPQWLDQGLRCPGEEAPTRLLVNSNNENARSSRRGSVVSNPDSVSQLLEQTTLGELMVAVDNVRRKSMIGGPPPGLLPVPGQQVSSQLRLKAMNNVVKQEAKRKSSLMAFGRRLSSRPGRNSEETVQGTLGMGLGLPRRTSQQLQKANEKTEDASYHTVHM